MKEESMRTWKRNHEDGGTEEKCCRRSHGRGITEEETGDWIGQRGGGGLGGQVSGPGI